MTRWTALVKTRIGILQRVEFDSISPWRQDAIAQAESQFGAEIISCNPVGNTYNPEEPKPKVPNGIGIDGNWVGDLLAIPFVIVLFLGSILVIGLWHIIKWFILAGIILFLVWAIRKLRQP